MNKKHMFALGGSLLLGVAVSAQADTTPSEADVLRAKVSAMESRLAELEGKQNGTWLNERRAEEVKSLVREVLADADTRASLAGGATAGNKTFQAINGSNFFMASEDGTFLLTVSGLIQARYIVNIRDGASDPGSTAVPTDDVRSGFSIMRARLMFDGYIGSPKLSYQFWINSNRNSEAVYAEQFKIAYEAGEFMDGKVVVAGGRFKAPFLREELVNDENQTAVERSSFNELFTTGRVEGIGVWWSGDSVKWAVMFNDGANSGEPTAAAAGNDFNFDDTDLALTGRVDIKLDGNWAQAKDFAAWSGEPTGIFLGAAVHYELAESGTNGALANPNSTFISFTMWTVDGQVECHGFSLYAAIAGLHTQINDDVGAPNSTDDYGVVVQAAYMLMDDKVQPFIRYEWFNLDFGDGAAPEDHNNLNIITFGANYFIKKNQARVTVDVVIALDPLAGNAGGLGAGANTDAKAGVSNKLGLLTDNGGKEGQVALRAQVQLMF